jgi:NhaA family Na+:H+ antiporter
VLVIALFYTAELSLIALAIGGLMLTAMFAANALGVRHPVPYLLLGILLWGAILASGVHATVAGVLGALAIPARSRIDANEFASRARGYLREFEDDLQPGMARPTQDQSDAVISLERAGESLVTPLLRLEHALHPWVAWVVMPVFALANAGIALDASITATLTSPLTIGVILGLFLGKQVGVMLFAWAAVRLRIADLPSGASWRQLYGVAMLCGIGFTMSLFIANLAFADAEMLEAAKTGILIASLLAGIAGWLVLRSTESAAGSE